MSRCCKAADLHEGGNIFSVNLAQVRDRIQQLPQADEVEVVRKLPGEIDIRIVERRPVAWITSETEITDPFTSDNAFLVGRRGVLMKQKKLLPEYLGLPLILGCTSESLESGKVIDSPEAKTALELLSLTERSCLTNTVSDSRNRYFQKLLSRGDRKKPRPRHVWVERSRGSTAAAASVP